jgi:lipopolysaccharide biosynthesis protein
MTAGLVSNLVLAIRDQLGLHPANGSPLRSQIRAEFPADGREAPRVCLFAHYDPHGRIDPYVTHYLRDLFDEGFQIVFVSTSPHLNLEDAEHIRSLCSHIALRSNVSLDFGSWRLGVELLGRPLVTLDQLLLANDSVYGPFVELSGVFGSMKSCDFWGMTESFELQQHVQSYFVVFEKRALEAGWVDRFWREFVFYESKPKIIRRYELGMSNRARRAGMRIGAFAPKMSQDRRNPTLYFWDQLISEHGFPFLKTECLKLNRTRSPAIRRWKELLSAQGSRLSPEVIEAHLVRVGICPELR